MNKLEIAYEAAKELKRDGKAFVYGGTFMGFLEAGTAIFEAIHQKNYGNAIVFGIASLITGYFTYKVHKKNQGTDEKLKNLETKLEELFSNAN